MERRKKKLIRHDVQLRVILIGLCVACLVLLINFQLSLASLWSVSSHTASNLAVNLVLDELRSSLIGKFFLSIGLTIPLAAAVGVVYSFKFAGPLYRFGQYFGNLRTGRWDQHCSLRKGDDLQDLCTAINEALDPVRAFLRENRALLGDVEALLHDGDPTASATSQDRVAAVRERIRAARDIFEARFPAAAAVETTKEPERQLEPQA